MSGSEIPEGGSNELSRNDRFLQNLDRIIESNLSNDQFGVEQLAESLNISRTQLFRRLQKLTGKNISQYLREYRLKKALELIKKDVASASEIAYQVGFSSPSYFNKCFHDFIGFSPGEVRKRSHEVMLHSVSKIKENYLIDKESEKDIISDRQKKKNIYYFVAGIIVVIISFLVIWKYFTVKQIAESDKSIAVLPIKSLSNDPEKQYLADGIMDAITNHLSKIKNIRVIARTSMEKYRDQPKDIREIGKEVRVNYLLEGSFQFYGNKARLIMQLINANDGSHIWSQEYDREWADILKVQSEVAQKIASEVKVVLTQEEKKIIETIPTSEIAAYEFYLRGEEYYSRSDDKNDMRFAIQMYEHAIEIDPNFTLAWVGLASSSRNMYWYFHDRSEKHRQRTKQYLDKAIELDPERVEVKLEEAKYYYQCNLNYKKALQILEVLKSKYPRNAEVYFWMAVVYKRIGKFTKSIDFYNQAIKLNPYYWKYWRDKAAVLKFIGNYNEAEECFKKVINLNPSLYSIYGNLIWLYYCKGDMDELNEFLNTTYITLDSSLYIRLEREILNSNYNIVIEIIESYPDYIVSDRNDFFSKNWDLGWLNYLNGNEKMAYEYFEKERIFLEEKANGINNDSRIYCSLGRIYAVLGNKSKSIEYGKKAIELYGLKNDAFGGIWNELELANNLMWVGDHDEAIKRYEYLLNYTKTISVELLRNSYQWRPFLDNEKFKKLLSNPKYQISISD